MNTELVAFPDDLCEFLDVGVIILSFFGFNTLPGHMEPDVVETPVFEVVEVNVGEGVISAEGLGVGVEWECFVDGVDAVEDGCAVVLVDEEGGLRVDSKRLNCGGSKSKDK